MGIPQHVIQRGNNREPCFYAEEDYRRYLNDLHVDGETLHEMRDSLNHELIPGRSYFKDKIEELTNRQTRLGEPGRPGRVEDEQGVYLVGF